MILRLYPISFILTLFAFGAQAGNWTLKESDGQLAPIEVQKLVEKVPEIRTGEDVELLLRTVGKLYTVSGARVSQESTGQYILEIQHGRRINRIRLITKTSTLKSEIQQAYQPFLFMGDSAEIQNAIQNRVSELLKQKGWPKSKVKIEIADKKSRELTYHLHVDFGEPCVIEALNLSFALPREFEIDIHQTDICDRDMIEEKARLLVDELQDAGYKKAEMENVKYLYNSQRNTIRVLIDGTLGAKVKYELRDVTSRFFLEDLFDAEEISDLDPSFTSPDAFMVEVAARYRKKGFDDVSVSLISEPNLTDQEQVFVFGVDPGRVYYLDKISVTGETGMDEGRIKEMIDQKPFWSRRTIFDRVALTENLSVVRNSYLALGFWKVQISEPIFSKNSDTQTVSMTVSIDEGDKRVLGGIRIDGAHFFESSSLLEDFEVEVGSPINRQVIIELERKIRRKYFDAGFLYTTSTLSFEESEPNIKKEVSVQIGMSVDERKRVKVGDVEISGLVDTKRQVVEREVLFETGEWYIPEVIDQTRRNLLTIGVFQTVSIDAMHPEMIREEPEKIDIVIDVRERPPGSIAFGPGWSLNDGNRFTVESSYSNISGLGRQVFAKGLISEDANQDAIGPSTLLGRNVTVGFLEPYLFKAPINASFSIFHSARAYETWNTSQGSELSFSHRLRKYFLGATISAFYAFKSTQEQGSKEQEAGYLELLGGDLKISRIGLRWHMDERDDAGWPTRGYYFSVETSAARKKIAGDVDYDQWAFTLNNYFLVPASKFVVASSLSLTSYLNVKRDGDHPNILPQSETLHLGGADSVRGFGDRSLGPNVQFQKVSETGGVTSTESTRLGGSQSALFKFELRYLTSYMVGLIGFLDFGSLFFSPSEIADFNRLETNEAAADGREKSVIKENAYYGWKEILTDPVRVWKRSYSSIGTGASYLTPLGTLNFAYGIPWRDCSVKGECVVTDLSSTKWLMSGRFHLNISTTF